MLSIQFLPFIFFLLRPQLSQLNIELYICRDFGRQVFFEEHEIRHIN